MDESIQSLNDQYREYFLSHTGQVKRDLQKLERYLVDHHCTFRGVAMPTLLKPNFLSPGQTALLKRSVEVMSRALTKFIKLYLEDNQVKELMGFSDREDELFRIDPGYSNPLVVSRLDAFLTGDSIRFLEFNCDSPAGIAYADGLEDGFRELFVNYPFLAGYRVEYARRQEVLISSLLECYGEFREKRRNMPEKPVMAIVDWSGVSTYSEFEMHRKHFNDHGFDTVIATPQDFSVMNGKAFAGGKEVHLVYKRVITRELLTRWDEVGSFLEAVRGGLVCCCNSFRSLIVGNKKVLAVITDPRFRSIFSRREQELIKKTVPWTKVLAARRERYRGKIVDLRTFIPEHRESLVLKPSNRYGGKDVYIGMETPQSTWEGIMERHIEDQNWVVQEFVDIPTGEYPEIDRQVRFKEKYVNINPYALNGKYSGTITRVSDSQVINVSAGGGLVPTLTVDPLNS
jgi:glutathionylspermidine synthase